ncbi:hypothetical protein MVEN_02200300 [Mycena venus]|uniref:Uncharacterized protein n=1 Tax=Mycena venus TaxID=2733690 RepID=A0A8H7CF86_9AGAR|nr:hypothetical protein MVEN_02200300 [Mycena venus]
MFDRPSFILHRDTLVAFELRIFPNPTNLNPNSVNNYLLIFDDILESSETHGIIDTCKALNCATRHVLANIILKQNGAVSHSDLRKLNCEGVFNSADTSECKAVIAALCSSSGDNAQPLCTDEPLLTALNRLTIGDLKGLANKHGIKIKRVKDKNEWIKAFEKALSQTRLNLGSNSLRPLKELLMPEVTAKLEKSRKRRLLLKADVNFVLESHIRSYFQSRTDAPACIPRRPFLAIRRRFCE